MLAESGPGESRVAADLSEDELRALLERPDGIADITTYTVRGARQYAVVLDPRAGPSLPAATSRSRDVSCTTKALWHVARLRRSDA